MNEAFLRHSDKTLSDCDQTGVTDGTPRLEKDRSSHDWFRKLTLATLHSVCRYNTSGRFFTAAQWLIVWLQVRVWRGCPPGSGSPSHLTSVLCV